MHTPEIKYVIAAILDNHSRLNSPILGTNALADALSDGIVRAMYACQDRGGDVAAFFGEEPERTEPLTTEMQLNDSPIEARSTEQPAVTVAEQVTTEELNGNFAR